MHRGSWLAVMALASIGVAATSFAQTPQASETGEPTGMPPPDASALVTAPKLPAQPKLDEAKSGVHVTMAAGGMWTTGNSRTLALSWNSALVGRFGDNAIGTSIVGNYGQGGPIGQLVQVTAENLQTRIRYDRYILDEASLFLIDTFRHDRFQGIDLRQNVDPGIKYVYAKAKASAAWLEAGYDFQFEVRRNEDRALVDASGNPVLGVDGKPVILDRTDVEHSTRAFAGARHAFNKETTLTAGVEYLQSVEFFTRYRVNFDAVFASKVGGGLAVGLGFTARYDHAPIPGKALLDTSSIVSLIYSYSSVAPPAPSTCPCPKDAPGPGAAR